jgi:hypothetical protein
MVRDDVFGAIEPKCGDTVQHLTFVGDTGGQNNVKGR